MAQPPHLRPTYQHPEARAYRAPGGPWDGPSLDVLLSHAASDSTGPLVVEAPDTVVEVMGEGGRGAV